MAFLKIIDDFNKIEINIIYRFNKVISYNKLLQDLPKIYRKVNDYDVNFIYNERIVVDLNDYILPRDKICAKLVKKSYFFYDVISNSIIRKSDNIEDLYKFYLNVLYDKIDCEILLYEKKANKRKLIDVLDSPNRHKNNCINRLIKRYNY